LSTLCCKTLALCEMTGSPDQERAIAMLLRRLDDAAERGAPLPPEVAVYVRQSLARWHAGQPFAEAWGIAIARRPGQRSRGTIERLAARDQAIRELRRRYFGNLGITTAAAAIANAVKRHRAGAWRSDHGYPDEITDGQRRLLAEVVRQCDRVPTQRRILDILRNELPSIHCAPDAAASAMAQER
jgi:hypothetical protein